MEKAIGKNFFAVDAVLGQNSQVLDVKAGGLKAVEDATWPLANQRTNIRLDSKEPADILIFGVPRNFHYGPEHDGNSAILG